MSEQYQQMNLFNFGKDYFKIDKPMLMRRRIFSLKYVLEFFWMQNTCCLQKKKKKESQRRKLKSPTVVSPGDTVLHNLEYTCTFFFVHVLKNLNMKTN